MIAQSTRVGLWAMIWRSMPHLPMRAAARVRSTPNGTPAGTTNDLGERLLERGDESAVGAGSGPLTEAWDRADHDGPRVRMELMSDAMRRANEMASRW